MQKKQFHEHFLFQRECGWTLWRCSSIWEVNRISCFFSNKKHIQFLYLPIYQSSKFILWWQPLTRPSNTVKFPLNCILWILIKIFMGTGCYSLIYRNNSYHVLSAHCFTHAEARGQCRAWMLCYFSMLLTASKFHQLVIYSA